MPEALLFAIVIVLSIATWQLIELVQLCASMDRQWRTVPNWIRALYLRSEESRGALPLLEDKLRAIVRDLLGHKEQLDALGANLEQVAKRNVELAKLLEPVPLTDAKPGDEPDADPTATVGSQPKQSPTKPGKRKHG